MGRSHTLIRVILFGVYAISVTLVDTRCVLRRALETYRSDDEIESFLQRVSYDEKMDSGHSIPEKDEGTRRRACFTLREVLVN